MGLPKRAEPQPAWRLTTESPSPFRWVCGTQAQISARTRVPTSRCSRPRSLGGGSLCYVREDRMNPTADSDAIGQLFRGYWTPSGAQRRSYNSTCAGVQHGCVPKGSSCCVLGAQRRASRHLSMALFLDSAVRPCRAVRQASPVVLGPALPDFPSGSPGAVRGLGPRMDSPTRSIR